MTKKKILKKIDIILMIVAAFIFLFTVTMIVIFCVKGSVPDSLVTSVYSMNFIELISMACITISKNIVLKRNGEEDE